MRRVYIRPEQTQFPAQRFPLFARAGHDAADLWLQCAPLSMGEFRDLCFRNFIAGRNAMDDYAEQRGAFDDAFVHCIAHAIAAASRAATGANRCSEGAFGR